MKDVAPEETQAEQPQSEETPKSRGGVLSALGGTAALYAAMYGLGSMVDEHGPDRGLLSRLRQYGRVSRGMGMNILTRPELWNSSSPAYDWLGDHVMVPANVSDAVLAHELGHARNTYALGPALGISQVPGRLLPSGLAAALYSAGAARPSLVPGIINAALMAPVLADEFGASARAVNYMVRRDGVRGLANSAKLLPAYGTYALSALGPFGIALLRRGLADRDQPSPPSAEPAEERTNSE